MASTTNSQMFHKTFVRESPVRQRVMGAFFLLLALSIWFFFARSVDGSAIASFGLSTFQARPNSILGTCPPSTLFMCWPSSAPF